MSKRERLANVTALASRSSLCACCREVTRQQALPTTVGAVSHISNAILHRPGSSQERFLTMQSFNIATLFQQFILALASLLAHPQTPERARSLFRAAAVEFIGDANISDDALPAALSNAFGLSPEWEAKRAAYSTLAESFVTLLDFNQNRIPDALDCGDVANSINGHLSNVYDGIAAGDDYRRNDANLKLIQVCVVTVSAIATGYVNAFAHKERLGLPLSLLLAALIMALSRSSTSRSVTALQPRTRRASNAFMRKSVTARCRQR